MYKLMLVLFPVLIVLLYHHLPLLLLREVPGGGGGEAREPLYGDTAAGSAAQDDTAEGGEELHQGQTWTRTGYCHHQSGLFITNLQQVDLPWSAQNICSSSHHLIGLSKQKEM